MEINKASTGAIVYDGERESILRGQDGVFGARIEAFSPGRTYRRSTQKPLPVSPEIRCD
jgi:hypothetical protein